MAGSLNHIIDDDGSFTMEHIENMGDAHEALEECHAIIAWLLAASSGRGGAAAAKFNLDMACEAVNAPKPKTLPVLASGM